jgi:hypothetical protein
MRIKSALLATALVVVSLVAIKQPAIADSLNVPKTTFPVCSETRTDYCIESVSLQSPGGTVENLVYQANGVALPAPTASATPGATPAPAAPATADPNADLTDAGTGILGAWTSPTWVAAGHSALGYSGLAIDAKSANSFSNWLHLQVKAAKIDSANKTTYAFAKGTTNPASLNRDDIITVKIRVQNFQAGVTVGFGTSVHVDRQGSGSANTLTISGSAIPLAVAGNTKDCEGESGKAAYNYDGFGAMIAPTNDPISGFGVDGVSGNMVVQSNGICNLATPTWDSSDKSLNWIASAPHYAADGKTINQGFYQAAIPVADAALLWGLDNPKDAASALIVSMTTDANGTDVNTVKSIAVKNNYIIISSTGFQYSSPKFKIAKNPKYLPTKPVSKVITCVKGKTVKKTVAPICPRGFKLKK